jgi:hypothetical protein
MVGGGEWLVRRRDGTEKRARGDKDTEEVKGEREKREGKIE